MPKVICTLPNASHNISGVSFEPHDEGVISEEIDQAVADRFASIPGYYIVGDAEQKKAEDPVVVDMDALRERAEALGVKVNPRWKHERLSSEIARAESALAESDAAGQDK